MRLSGLAPGLVVRRGSFLSWQHGTNPVRYAFHQLAEGLTADGTGVMGWAEVAPGVRPGHSIGTTVQVGVPRLEAVMVPGSLRPGRARNTMAEGLAFDWQQTLR